MSTRKHRGSGRGRSRSLLSDRLAPRVTATAAIAVCSFATSTSFADTVYVPDDYPTIQQAIDAVADDDEIIVRPGEYHEALDLMGKRIFLRSQDGPDETDLIGTGLAASIITADSGESLDTVVEGFAIRDGLAENGGGLLISGGSALTVRNCQVALNDAISEGGGVWISDGHALFSDCTFDNNAASAIRCERADVRVVRCVFELNFGSSGAAIDGSETTLQIEDSDFRFNASWSFGGAILLNRGALSVAGSTFAGNASILDQSGGGAMYLANPVDVVVNDCRFEENRSGSGGAIAARDLNLDISDCRFSGNDAFGFEGGAIQTDDGNLTITGSQFLANFGSSHAGAIAASVNRGQTILIDRCSFNDNSCYYDGGALNVEVRGATGKAAFVREREFEDNAAFGNVARGGAAYSFGRVAFETCIFKGNDARTGGAVASFETDDDLLHPTFNNCVFEDNTASFDGGAIAVENLSLSEEYVVLDCIFESNHAAGDGGAAAIGSASARFVNAAMFMNTSGNRGGAVYGGSNADLDIHNCTIVYNGTAGVGGGVYSHDGNSTQIVNSIVYGNTGGQIDQLMNETIVRYSNVEGDFAGVGNIDADPVFSNVDDFDLRLTSGSPCIDAGNSDLVPDGIELDLLGNARFIDDLGKFDSGVGTHPPVDMGALEYTKTSIFSLTILPLPIVGGEPVTLRVDNAARGTKLWVFYGLSGLGETFVPPLNVTLDLDNARLALSGRTDGKGVFEQKLDAPNGIAGQHVWLQAAQAGRTSNYLGTRGVKQ